MNISQDDNKINDYTEFLSARTNISKTRLKKMLTMDVVKLITLTDIVQIANAILISKSVVTLIVPWLVLNEVVNLPLLFKASWIIVSTSLLSLPNSKCHRYRA